MPDNHYSAVEFQRAEANELGHSSQAPSPFSQSVADKTMQTHWVGGECPIKQYKPKRTKKQVESINERFARICAREIAKEKK